MTKQYGLSGVGSDLQFGKAGTRIIQSAGAFSARNTTDSAYVNFFVLDPTLAQHAATKAYVDANVQGLDTKQSVEYATTTALPAVTYNNGTLGAGATLTADANGALSVDGSSPIVGNRILVKNQATQTQNGIYVVTATGDGSNPFILTRTTDTDNSPANEVSGGMYCFVTGGSLLADTGWVMSSPDGVAVIGTDNLIFTQFSSAGIITVSAGSALDKTGNDLSVRVDGVTMGINAVGNGQLIVRSTATLDQVLLSSGTAGTAAAWGFVEDLKGKSTGQLIIDGIDNGGTDTNYLAITTSDGAPGTVTLAATSATTTNVDLILDGKGTGLIVVSDAISTLSNANLILQPNGTGLIEVSAEITTQSNANLILNPNGTGLVEVGATVTTTSNADLVLDPNGTGLIAVGSTVTTLSNADLVLDPNGTGLIAVGSAITTLANANLMLSPNGTGLIDANANIDIHANSITTSTSNGDILILPNGTGVISVAGTTNYETNVTADDDIPNKKYVDDAITSAAPATVARASVSADSVNSSFDIGTTLPDVAGKNTYITKVVLQVSTPFTGGSVTQAKVVDSLGNVFMTFTENDISIADTYVAILPLAIGSDGEQMSIDFYQVDGTTLAVPTAGAAIASVLYDLA